MICGKIIFATRQLAVNSLRGFNNDKRNSKSSNKPANCYYCESCGGYHITSRKKKRAKVLQETVLNTVHDFNMYQKRSNPNQYLKIRSFV